MADDANRPPLGNSGLPELPVDVLEIVLAHDLDDSPSIRGRRDRALQLSTISLAFRDACQRVDGHKMLVTSPKAAQNIISQLRDDRERRERVREVMLGPFGLDVTRQRVEPTWVWHSNEGAGRLIAKLLRAFPNLTTLHVELSELCGHVHSTSSSLPVDALMKVGALSNLRALVIHPDARATTRSPACLSIRNLLRIQSAATRLKTLRLLPGLAVTCPKVFTLAEAPAPELTDVELTIAPIGMPAMAWLGLLQLERLSLRDEDDTQRLTSSLANSHTSLRFLSLHITHMDANASELQICLVDILRDCTALAHLELDRLPHTLAVQARADVREEVARQQLADLARACPRAGVRITVLDSMGVSVPRTREVPARRAKKPVAMTVVTEGEGGVPDLSSTGGQGRRRSM